MKILVTGGAGFIGSHIVNTYINAGHDVIVIDDLSSGEKKFINPKANFYQLNIHAPEVRTILEKEKITVINHHAAQISVSDPRSLVVQPWDKTSIEMVSKGIQASDINITPQIEGDILRINIPPMTEETRINVVKILKQRSEESKVSVRNVRSCLLYTSPSPRD